ncbi:MAG: bifunctional 5,10-methylenetetrahydrofolate dehydrogenase/5,10-methenyltetrahydrofolate cyclohydrolase [Candidatus Neomarinimicrobiota bacterium]
METKILSGKAASDSVYKSLIPRISALKSIGITPGLAVILVGNDIPSKLYVTGKTKKFQTLGLHSQTFNFSGDASQESILEKISELNRDTKFHGILVQLPLPPQINSDTVLESINPLKDVDGFHPWNLGKLCTGRPQFIPCTPKGIMRIMKFYDINPAGKHVVVVGRSNIVGRPISILMSLKSSAANSTVTLCHSGTKNISAFTLSADIIVLALGQPEFLRGDQIKKGAVVLDVGINRVADDSEKGYHITGDAHKESLIGKASALTPVPFGLGPMTIAMLVENTVEAAEILD